jgi:Tol biopolymer transport system component
MKERALLILSLLACIIFLATCLLAQDKYPVNRLISDRAQEGFSFWSPDGTKVAFTNARTGRMDVYVMEPDMQEIKREPKAANE